MVLSIATGLWYDHSKSGMEGATLTLKIDDANVLLSGLTFLVTVAAASFWNITAFLLHHLRSRKANPDHVDLQHRVLLRNAGPAGRSIVAFLKILVAWRGKRVPNLFLRSFGLVLPAAIVLAAFSAASVLVSRVANKSYAGTLARINPKDCGTLYWSNDPSFEARSWKESRWVNDSRAARAYVNEYYLDDSHRPISQSVHPMEVLPYKSSAGAGCPFPNSTRCKLGPSEAFSVTTDWISSNDLGINAAPASSISFQSSFTCSPLEVRDLVYLNTSVSIYGFPVLAVKMGSGQLGDSAGVDVTSHVFLEPYDSVMTYGLNSFDHVAGDNKSYNSWSPTTEFNRIDADVSLYIMQRHNVYYYSPVDDPFFAAHKTNTTYNGTRPDVLVSIIGCAQQYSLCNGNQNGGGGHCSPPAGLRQTTNRIRSADNPLGLSAAQMVTADRLLQDLFDARPENAVGTLKEEALYAKNRMVGMFSPGLPRTQWQVEVLGWFQIMLARLQLQSLQYASKTEMTLGLGAYRMDPWGSYTNLTDLQEEMLQVMRDQCTNQLVRTTGQVQNFSFVGIMVVVVGSVAIILLDWTLETLVDYVKTWLRRRRSTGRIARRADHKLQLLRQTLLGDRSHYVDDAEDGWADGFMGVPVQKEYGRVEVIHK